MPVLQRCARGAGFGLALVVAAQASALEIESARYDGPTQRYPHGVLGDDIEYDTLVVRLSDGREMSARWGDDMVFEDLAPRVVDVDGDGVPEDCRACPSSSGGAFGCLGAGGWIAGPTGRDTAYRVTLPLVGPGGDCRSGWGREN